MRSSHLTFAAVSLQELIRQNGSYDHVGVKPRAGHIVIEVVGPEGESSVVARATALGGSAYGLSFRTSGGRWEPMPVSGSLEDIAAGLVALLGPYLDPSNLR